ISMDYGDDGSTLIPSIALQTFAPISNGNSVEIFDMSGRKILTGSLNDIRSMSAVADSLSQGLYLLVMQTENGPQVRQWFIGK
ncbi:MAG: T9SS type A sorting domain-containing protein, partial [Flavobacteriales bacterium]